jgi:hypothetical protein
MSKQDAALVKGLIEIAKTSLIAYFNASRLAGMTNEEIEIEYTKQRNLFYANTPDKLIDV